MIRMHFEPQTKINLLPWDKIRCKWIANYIIIQCSFVFVWTTSILGCFWSPDNAFFDFDKLVRIMYLYDYEACGYSLQVAKAISDFQLSNFTHGYNVLPIKWQPAEIHVSTRLSAKTRKYTELTIAVHFLWMLIAVILRIVLRAKGALDRQLFRLVIRSFLYMSIFMVCLDLSMAIVYVADIRQSLTKEMIVRYSGWSVEMKLENLDEFGGWVPIGASIVWLRGVVILIINIYCCKVIYNIRHRIKQKEFKKRMNVEINMPVPDAKTDEQYDGDVLYYRSGEMTPYNLGSPNTLIHRIFY